jgi:tRNA-specific 2-thiouridylase
VGLGARHERDRFLRVDVLKPFVNVDRDGEVLDTEGNVVGTHKGYMHYTIGKRKGFTVKGAHDPHYVLDIKPDTNQIVVGKKEALECRFVKIGNINMFDERTSFDTTVKLRYRTYAVPCHVEIDGDKATIELKESVYGVAKGQAAVFYDGNRLIGGGWIE